MKKDSSQALEQNDWQEFKPLFGGGKIKICDTLRAVTPFGGLSVLIEFFGRIGLVEQLHYFRRFSQAEIQRFWRPLWCWLISRLPKLEKGFSLDLDSTIFSRHGAQQQGATRGYNPRRPADSVIIRSWRSWQKSTLSYTVGCAVEMPGPVKGRRNS